MQVPRYPSTYSGANKPTRSGEFAKSDLNDEWCSMEQAINFPSFLLSYDSLGKIMDLGLNFDDRFYSVLLRS